MIKKDWYKNSVFLLHLDHHTKVQDEVGHEADPEKTERLLRMASPDCIQIHAKGFWGYTTYPSKIGFTPPLLKGDVLGLWTKLAEKLGVPFSCYYNIGRDKEIISHHPDWCRLDKDGNLYDNMLCYNTPVVDKYLWPQIEELMDIYNPAGFWFDGSCFTVRVCYCSECLKKFKQETGADAPRAPEEPLWDEFKEMHRQIYRDFIKAITARIKAKNSDCLVAFNASHSFIMPEAPSDVDYLTFDFISVSLLPAAYCRWCDGMGLPFELMTGVWLQKYDKIEKFGKKIKPACHLQQDMAQAISSGGRFNVWDNPTLGSGLVAERMEQIGKVIKPFMNDRRDCSIDSVRIPDASVLLGATDLYAKTRENTVCFPFPDWIGFLCDNLMRSGVNFELISEDRVNNLDIRSGLLILDDVLRLSEESIIAVKKYAGNGGRVALTGRSLEIGGFAGLGEGDGYIRLDKIFAKDKMFISEVLDKILPVEKRNIYSDLPGFAEVVLRKKGTELHVHIVNNSEGKREYEILNDQRTNIITITELPPVPAGKVFIRLGENPETVTRIPENEELVWEYKDGLLTVQIPEIAVHSVIKIGFDKI